MNSTVQAPVQVIEAVADLRLPLRSDRRLQSLMARNNEGALSTDQHDELESLVELSEIMSLLRAEALHLLGRKLK